MDATQIVVALIVLVGVLGAPIVTAVMQRKVQNENRQDHARVTEQLADLGGEVKGLNTVVTDLGGRVDGLTERIDNHIDTKD